MMMNNKVIRYLFILLSITFLSGCAQCLEVSIDPKTEICITDHAKYWKEPLVDGILSNFCLLKIEPDSKEIFLLQNWFKNNNEGWRNTPGSFVPGHTFKIDQFNFNLLEHSLIVNYVDSFGEGHQLAHKTTGTSFPFIAQDKKTP